MLGPADTIDTVASALEEHKIPTLVLDPVRNFVDSIASFCFLAPPRHCGSSDIKKRAR